MHHHNLTDRRSRRAVHVFTIVLAVLAFAVGAHATTSAPATPLVGECFEIRGHASFRGFGYKHIVTVSNKCARAIKCEVWTDVDPTPKHKLTVPKGEEKSVVTRIGSPASEFKADGTCDAPRKRDDV